MIKTSTRNENMLKDFLSNVRTKDKLHSGAKTHENELHNKLLKWVQPEQGLDFFHISFLQKSVKFSKKKKILEHYDLFELIATISINNIETCAHSMVEWAISKGIVDSSSNSRIYFSGEHSIKQFIVFHWNVTEILWFVYIGSVFVHRPIIVLWN